MLTITNTTTPASLNRYNITISGVAGNGISTAGGNITIASGSATIINTRLKKPSELEILFIRKFIDLGFKVKKHNKSFVTPRPPQRGAAAKTYYCVSRKQIAQNLTNETNYYSCRKCLDIHSFKFCAYNTSLHLYQNTTTGIAMETMIDMNKDTSMQELNKFLQSL